MPLSVFEFRDLDLMVKLAQEGDAEGWVDGVAFAEALGFEKGTKTASRLSWMRRYGMLEYDEETHMWRLSPGGIRVANAHLKSGQVGALEKIPDESMVEVMSHVTSRWRHGDPLTAHLLRREFLFGTQRR
jgi:DNA-binding IclR family transcriptional regulator